MTTTVTLRRSAAMLWGLAALVASCRAASDSASDTAAATPATNPDAPVMVRGTVASVSPTELVLQSDSGTVTVKTTQPIEVYTRVSSTLGAVKESTFIGVTTVEQPDGTERATEIHIFPEALRGVGEGSRMMAPDTSSTAKRMTNGNVSASRMTNGTATPSRMSNGSVASSNGSTLVVQYAGGSQTVTVPPGVVVTELKLSAKSAAVGDKLAVMAKKNADGSLTADKAISTAK